MVSTALLRLHFEPTVSGEQQQLATEASIHLLNAETEAAGEVLVSHRLAPTIVDDQRFERFVLQ